MKPVAALVLILLAGCTTTQPYRTSGAPCTAGPDVDCSRSVLVTEHAGTDSEYDLAFLEYDDQGQLHTPTRPVRGEDGISAVESSVIMDRLRSLAAKEDIFLIAYIHGWHHNANNSPEDSNVKEFRNLLASASQIDRRKVFGVYIGWRGRALPGILDYSTFWNRKSTAHEVGYQGISEALLEIEHVVKAGGDRNRMVSIGHSFGGAALFSSVDAILADRYVESRRAEKTAEIEGFGDLVLLLNPAFEALRYSALFDMAQDGCRPYSNKQKPRLVVLSSYDDFPVSVMFQAGRYLSTYLFESHRNSSTIHCNGSVASEWQVAQSRADVLAVGHYYPYVSHELDSSTSALQRRYAGNIPEPSRDWQTAQKIGAFDFRGGIMISKNTTQPFNPYMNIITDKGVISGHNDIWNPKVRAFVYSLLEETAR